MQSLNETADLHYVSKFRGAMLSYTFVNSHSQVSYPGTEGPLFLIMMKLENVAFSTAKLA